MKGESRKFISLKVKLAIALVIYNLILVFGVPAIYYGYFYPKESENLEVLIRGLEKMATFRLQTLLDPVDRQGIESVLPRIIVVKELKYAGVYDSQNKLVAEVYEDEKVIDDAKEIFFPVLKNGKKIGSYKFIFTEKYVKEAINKGIRRALIVLLVNALLSFFLLMMFLRFVITKQIGDTTNYIKNFDQSTTSLPDPLEMNRKRFFRDEFDLVTEELNKLVGKIVIHNREEKQKFNIIESEVYKRTDALLQAKQKADKAVQEKIEFMGLISHEIRNPINAILGFSELLQKEVSDKGELIRPIVESSLSLLNLVNDLLDISKVEVGKLKIEVIPTKTFDFIKSLERIYRHKVESKGLIFTSLADENFPRYLVMDSLRLSQVLSNLVENSLKFTKDGFVKITYNHTISKLADKVNIKITVEDSGMGIPKKDWPHIFEKFRQPKEQSYLKFKGSGLGLSICKKITQLMGGDINLVEKLGNGSLFVIDLPNVSLASPGDFKEEIFAEEYFFEKSKVLLVEDEKVIQDLVKWNLKAFPIELLIANNGKEGINLALMHKPDLILMDILMPNMDGIESIELIRVYESLKKTPIIIISGLLDPQIDSRILNMVQASLKKPVLQRDFYKELAKFLPHKIKKRRIEKEEKNEEPLPEVIKKKLLELYLSKINNLAESMSIEEGKDLAKNIHHFAKNNNLKSLIKWSDEFNESLARFDIKLIKSKIFELKELISII